MATAPEVPNFAQFNFVEGDTIAMITKQNGQNAALVSYGQGLETFGEEIEQEQAEAIQTVENIRDNEVIPARDAAQAAATAASESEQQAEYWADQAAGSVADGYIDDSVTATNKTWSSSKIDARLNADRDPTISFDFVRDEYFIDNGERTFAPAEWAMTVERASPKWVFGPNGMLREVPVNTVARQWDPVTGEPLGALIEKEATNLFSTSNDPTAWNTSGTSMLLNGAVIESVNNVNGINRTVVRLPQGEGARLAMSASSLPDGTYTAWARVRVLEGWKENVLLISASGATSETGGFSTVANPPSDGSWGVISRTFDAVSSSGEVNLIRRVNSTDPDIVIEVEAQQLEEGSVPSSYIPTTDAQVTRAADNVSRELGAEFRSDEGTLFYEGDATGDTSYSALLSISSGSVDNRILLAFSGGGDAPYAVRAVRYDTEGNTNKILGSLFPGGRYKAAVSYSATSGTVTLACNGEAATFPAKFNDVEDLRELSVGTIEVGGSSNTRSNGATGHAGYYPRALTEAELVELTS